MPLYMKSGAVSAEAMFTRSLFGTADIACQHDILTTVGKLVDAGKLAPTASANLGPITAANLAKGHAQLADGHVVGKLVLSGWE